LHQFEILNHTYWYSYWYWYSYFKF